MPELPEVETVRRTVLPYVEGRRVQAVQVYEARLRSPVDAAALAQCLTGRTVVTVRRRAKYLLFDCEGGVVLMVHLGMTGRLGIVPAEAVRQTHDHAVFLLSDGAQMRFNDSRRFGLIEVFPAAQEATHPRLINLGCEPLDPAAFNGARLHTMTRGIKKPIKNFLMDGTRIVGVGNIYACESLFAAGVHPRRAAGRLSEARCASLATAVVRTLERAIVKGGTTLRDFANVRGEAGYFAVDLQVYGRQGQPCPRCARPIVRLLQAGRSTFYCGACQR